MAGMLGVWLGYLAMLQVQTDGTVKVASRQGVQVGATSATELKAGEVYRYDWSVTLGMAGSSNITAAVCRPDAAPMAPAAADLKFTSTAVDLSSYVAAGIQSMQWGNLNPGATLGRAGSRHRVPTMWRPRSRRGCRLSPTGRALRNRSTCASPRARSPPRVSAPEGLPGSCH